MSWVVVSVSLCLHSYFVRTKFQPAPLFNV